MTKKKKRGSGSGLLESAKSAGSSGFFGIGESGRKSGKKRRRRKKKS